MNNPNFTISVKNKKILKNPSIKHWIRETEKYLNYKLDREIEGIVRKQVEDKVRKMIYGKNQEELKT